MTNQDKIAYLRQYRTCGAEIQRLEDEITRWRAKAEKTTTTIKDIPVHCSSADKLQEAVAEIDELITRLAAEQHKLAWMRLDIERAIGTVPEMRLQELLRYRYIDGMTFESIAVRMNYSWRQTIRLHGIALCKMSLNVI